MTAAQTDDTSPTSTGVRDQTASDVARLGQPRTRIDGPLKVCGLAEYPGDVSLPGMAHAALAVSAIARGRVTSISRKAATTMPGVLLILTHEDVGDAIGPVGHLMEGGYANSSQNDLIEFRPFAVLLAGSQRHKSQHPVHAAPIRNVAGSTRSRKSV